MDFFSDNDSIFFPASFWAAWSILPDHGPKESTFGSFAADGGDPVPEAGRLPILHVGESKPNKMAAKCPVNDHGDQS